MPRSLSWPVSRTFTPCFTRVPNASASPADQSSGCAPSAMATRACNARRILLLSLKASGTSVSDRNMAESSPSSTPVSGSATSASTSSLYGAHTPSKAE